MTQKIKEPVKIRRKKLANGNVSLYLAIYINGHREYEFLRLYLIPEKAKRFLVGSEEPIISHSVQSQKFLTLSA